jgi:3-phenylpropionate/trans-cinnamate dioxygenase ferredoxin reductase component
VPSRILIAGGGLAAQRAAETLRARGHDGAIRVICAEPVAPYDRPPLSKELVGTPFRPDGWYAKAGVELLLGRRACALDVRARRVTLDRGSEAYEALVVATGARPRRLPALAGRPNALELRTVADAARLRSVLVPGARLAIVGGGFVGLEVAATARRLGVSVTVIEAAEAPLARVLGPPLGGWFAALHRDAGVRVELGAGVEAALPAVAGAPVSSLVLVDGRSVEADVVLSAVGVVPETRWLAGSRLAGNRVAVDECGRTVVPGVRAAGDVVGGDHWEPAARLGAAAARSILGLDMAPVPPASFWSDQYGIRIQLVGSAAGADAVELDGSLDDRSFTAALWRRGVLCGALLVGRPRDLPTWRRRLADAAIERKAA